MTQPPSNHLATCARLARAIGKTHTIPDIYRVALDALTSGLGVDRAAILLFDPDGVMRFKDHIGLSDAYRRTVEGHTPWTADTPDPQPIWINDVHADGSLRAYGDAFRSERIAALAFVPMVCDDKVIGKFMLYYAEPTPRRDTDLELACIIASQIAFAVDRTRTEEQVRRSEERLRFALDAAMMGTWDWDLTTNAVHWSDDLAAIHGLPAGSFDGTFASYEKEIHPEDRAKVFASVDRALREGVPHDVEYRLVAPDGSIRWCEGKGRVERDQHGKPVRMSGVCVIVTRRKEAELARIASAEESSRIKDEFLATLSHELRTPLNAIIGWVQMLQTGNLPAEQHRRAIEVIARNARLQTQLIEDILDVSRIITGKLEIERLPVSTLTLLETAAAGVMPAAAAKQLRLQQVLDAALPPIEGDPKRLHQVLNNVLSNAIKFTPSGGTITLSCRVDGDALAIEVKDSGIGIDRDFLPFVFDRFRQADSRATRAHGGLGLGLAIARHIIDEHGGTITARSDGPNQGTMIRITLPLTAVSHRAATPQAAGDARIDVRLAGVNVLVVVDQLDSREMVATALQQRGALVSSCESATAALDLLKTHPVSVLIADIAMPQLDGYELMRRLRAEGRHVAAIAVTAFARPEDRRLALEAGYLKYLSKPVDAAELADAVRELADAINPAADLPRPGSDPTPLQPLVS